MLVSRRFKITLSLLAVLAAGALTRPAAAQEFDPRKEPPKVYTERELRAAEVEAAYNAFRTPPGADRVIYGNDDRKDFYQVSDPFVLSLLQATAVLLLPGDYTNNGDGTYTINAVQWFSQGGTSLCTDEPFRGQYVVGNCSAFLVGQQIIATAGHCANVSDCGANPIAFWFNHRQYGPATGPNLVIPAADIYFCNGVINREQSGEFDHAVLQLDRPVTGVNPVPIRRTGDVAANDALIMIGYPVTLPVKVDGGGVVKAPRPGGGYFTANVDAYGGNSGSAVFNATTGVVEGILVRGNTDFVTVGGCRRSNVCSDTTGCNNTYEEISKVWRFVQYVPELGVSVQPAVGPLHIGVVGGPFTDDTLVYTLTNPTADPANYSVSIVAGGSAPLLLDGGAGPISGTLPGNGSAQITVALGPDAATLPAGNYATDVRFEDTTNSIITTRTHTLEVGQTGITITPADGLFAGGPLGGPFTATKTYTITSTRPTPVDVLVTADQNWISIDGGAGPVSFTLTGVGAAQDVVVGYSANANALPNGLYNGSVSIANNSGGPGSGTRPVQLDVGRFSYTSSDVPKPINDNSTVDSLLTVTDAYCIGDVNVEINITHTYRGDLVVELISPQGTTVRLHNRIGGSEDNLIRTYDQGVTNPDGPGSLDDFIGEIVTGTWKLRVSDQAGSDTGTLNAWTLKIASSGAACPPEVANLSVNVPSTRTSSITMNAVSQFPAQLAFVITALPASGVLIDPATNAIIDAVPYTLANQGNVVKYRPRPLFAGVDSCQFKANDGQDSNIATISMNVGETAIYSYPLDTDPGWTTEDQWAFGVPTGQGPATDRRDPTSGYTGSNVYGYNLNGGYPNSMTATRYLTTPALDFTGVTGVKLQFRRWLGVERSQYDKATIDVSNNGTTWTQIWINPQPLNTSINENAWSLQTYDIAQYADNQAAVRVRWGMGPTDGSVTYQGWNLDDIAFLGLAPAGALGDLDCNGEVNFADIDAFVTALGGADGYAAAYPNCIWEQGDMNCDGSIDFADIDAFVACLSSGVCGCP